MVPYLSVKTLGAFLNWQADMKVGHAGRSSSPLMDKRESFQKRRAGTTDWTVLILWPPEPGAGHRMGGHAGRSPSLLIAKMKLS
jgi:hypothetical protein